MEKQRLTALDLETEINIAKCKMTIMSDTFSALLDKPVTHDIGLQDYLTEDGVAGLCFVFIDVVNLLDKIQQFFYCSDRSKEGEGKETELN